MLLLPGLAYPCWWSDDNQQHNVDHLLLLRWIFLPTIASILHPQFDQLIEAILYHFPIYRKTFLCRAPKILQLASYFMQKIRDHVQTFKRRSFKRWSISLCSITFLLYNERALDFSSSIGFTVCISAMKYLSSLFYKQRN